MEAYSCRTTEIIIKYLEQNLGIRCNTKNQENNRIFAEYVELIKLC